MPSLVLIARKAYAAQPYDVETSGTVHRLDCPAARGKVEARQAQRLTPGKLAAQARLCPVCQPDPFGKAKSAKKAK